MFLRRLRSAATTALILRPTYPGLYKSHILKLFEDYPKTRPWYRYNINRCFAEEAHYSSDRNTGVLW